MKYPLFFNLLIFITLLIVSFEALSQNKTDLAYNAERLKIDSIPKTNYSQMIDSIINCAEKYLGIKYKSGGTTVKGFDCSGFTSFVFSNYGINLPHSSRDQALKGIPVDVSEIKKGDLVFFKGRSQKRTVVGHVGLVVEKNDSIIRFIHSSYKKGIAYDFVSQEYYKNRFIGAKRILGDNIRDSLWAGYKLHELADEDSTEMEVEADKTVVEHVEKANQQETEKSNCKTYCVRKGETLYAIAKKNNSTPDKIKELNKLKSNKIYPGQKLVVE